MIKKALRLNLPTFRDAVLDLGNPSTRDLARALGVHPRTVERWLRADDAPRPVLLGLYWLTRWGQHQLDADLHYRATLYTQHIESVKAENARLQRELARVLALGDFGSANAPSWAATAAELMAQRRG